LTGKEAPRGSAKQAVVIIVIDSGLRLFSHLAWLGTGQFRWSIDTNGAIGTNRKGCHSNGSVGEYALH